MRKLIIKYIESRIVELNSSYSEYNQYKAEELEELLDKIKNLRL